ncbi:hypothetical protein LINPERPRIM_LOCUS5130 [Linum perenne]
MNKFLRDGTNVRVCVLRDHANPFPDEVKVNNEGESVVIPVVQHKPREYRRPGTVSAWQVKQNLMLQMLEGKAKNLVAPFRRLLMLQLLEEKVRILVLFTRK